MKRAFPMILIIVLLWGTNSIAQGEDEPPSVPIVGFQAGTGIQGIFSLFEAGVRFPRIRDNMLLSVKARYLSSLTWATFIHQTAGQVSFHPAVIGAAVTLGGSSPMLHGFVKAYGVFDVLLGYSFTPYDSAIYKVPNLIGDNLTYTLAGYFGLEIFTSPTLSVFIEAGGGFKSLFGDKDDLHVIASAWLGSGTSLKLGVNF